MLLISTSNTTGTARLLSKICVEPAGQLGAEQVGHGLPRLVLPGHLSFPSAGGQSCRPRTSDYEVVVGHNIVQSYKQDGTAHEFRQVHDAAILSIDVFDDLEAGLVQAE